MIDTFSLNKPEDQRLVVPCVLSLNRLEVRSCFRTGQT